MPKIKLSYALIAIVLIFVCAYAAVDLPSIMHSAQTMTREATTQHERIAEDRYNQPLVTIKKRPQQTTTKTGKRPAK